MSGRKSIYQNRRRRWLIIDAVSAVIGLVLYFTGVYELWFVLIVLFLFSWIIYILFGPGLMIGRVYAIQKEREIRELREFNAQWHKEHKRFCDKFSDKQCEEFFNSPTYCNDMTGNSGFSHDRYIIDDFDYDDLEDDDDYFDKYYDRHMRWIEEMKHECNYKGGGPGGEDTYSSPFLWRNIPLNHLKIFAGLRSFNFEVSQHIMDWDHFREYFPGLETWEDDEDDDEDYDDEFENEGDYEEDDYDDEFENEEDDIFYGEIVNEGGKAGDDYRIVPSYVRRWFPPYEASDGIITVHEDSYGVGDGWINPYDPLFGMHRK